MRLKSLDLFRGLTIFCMIFVNDVASVPNAPTFLKHLGIHENGMSLADLVFPMFLFIVGMSIPLSIDKKIARSGLRSTLKEIVLRSSYLILSGIFLVNINSFSDETIIPKSLWVILVILSL